jgi:hypothetical protein
MRHECGHDVGPFSCMRCGESIDLDALARAWAVENGWVEPKPCGDCEGGVQSSYLGAGPIEEWPCPSCGGTGQERLIALDAQTIQRFRWFSEGRANDETVSAYEVHNLINPIIAALEGETDE